MLITSSDKPARVVRAGAAVKLRDRIEQEDGIWTADEYEIVMSDDIKDVAADFEARLKAAKRASMTDRELIEAVMRVQDEQDSALAELAELIGGE